VTVNPHNLEAVKERAEAYRRAGEFDKAIADYTQALQLQPKDPALYAGRGFAELKKNDKANALNDFNKAIELAPDKSEYYTGRAYIFVTNGESAKAVSDFTHLISMKPDDADLYVRRGDVYSKLKQWDQAGADYEKALSLDQNNYLALAGKGYVMGQKGNVRAGADLLQKALQQAKDPEHQEEIRVMLRDIGVGPQL
jgi:Flp pilus assembly protein TadD